jgi:hypothetical protein
MYFNGERLRNISDDVGREMISHMKKTYFSLFDLIEMTDLDSQKKRLMKNKIKSIVMNVWGVLIKKYNDTKQITVLIDSMSLNGDVIQEVNCFINYAFSDDGQKNYFLKEALTIFKTQIYSLSIIDCPSCNSVITADLPTECIPPWPIFNIKSCIFISRLKFVFGEN